MMRGLDTSRINDAQLWLSATKRVFGASPNELGSASPAGSAGSVRGFPL